MSSGGEQGVERWVSITRATSPPSPGQVWPPVAAHLVLPADGRHGDVLLLCPHFHRLLPLPLPHGHSLLRHRPQQRLALYVATPSPKVSVPRVSSQPAPSHTRVSRQPWSGCPLARGRSWGPSWVTATPPGSSCWPASLTPSLTGGGCSLRCRCPSLASSSTHGEEERVKGRRGGWEGVGWRGWVAQGWLGGWVDQEVVGWVVGWMSR